MSGALVTGRHFPGSCKGRISLTLSLRIGWLHEACDHQTLFEPSCVKTRLHPYLWLCDPIIVPREHVSSLDLCLACPRVNTSFLSYNSSRIGQTNLIVWRHVPFPGAMDDPCEAWGSPVLAFAYLLGMPWAAHKTPGTSRQKHVSDFEKKSAFFHGHHS